jgi:hypothetical protein
LFPWPRPSAPATPGVGGQPDGDKLLHIFVRVLYISHLSREVRRNGLRSFEGGLKLKYIVWLICLLLFVAAVDTIPDPPAINPPAGHSSTIVAAHDAGPLTPFDKQWRIVSSSLRGLALNWFTERFALVEKPVRASLRPLVERASDPSPPACS